MTNQYRYKMNQPKPDSGSNKCATIIGGVGMFLGFASLAFFGKGDIHGLTLMYIIILVALNFLSYHLNLLRLLIAVVSGFTSIYLIIFYFPDFISTNLNRSQIGFYYIFLAIFSLSVCLCQLKALKILK